MFSLGVYPNRSTLLIDNTCGCRQLLVPRHHRSTFGHRAFSVPGLELVTRLPSKFDAFCWQWPENFSRSNNVHSALETSRLCAIAYKSTIDIDISTGTPASRGPSAIAGLLVFPSRERTELNALLNVCTTRPSIEVGAATFHDFHYLVTHKSSMTAPVGFPKIQLKQTCGQTEKDGGNCITIHPMQLVTGVRW